MRLFALTALCSLLVTLGWGAAHAAGTDKDSAEVIRLPQASTTGWLANPHQEDWYLIVTPPRSTGYVRVLPPPGIDVELDLVSYYSDFPYVTIDYSRYHNAQEIAYFTNGRSSAPNSSGVYLVVRPVSFRSNLFPQQYTMDFSVSDYNAPMAVITTAETHDEGDFFKLEPSYSNTSQQDKAFNIYLGMEYGGVVAWAPTWGPDVFPSQFLIEARRSEWWPEAPMYFTVPEGLGGFGPIRFFTAAHEPVQDVWSNLATVDVTFLEKE